MLKFYFFLRLLSNEFFRHIILNSANLYCKNFNNIKDGYL